MRVIFLANGLTSVFDENGEQVPELQVAWVTLYLEFLVGKGIDPTTVEFESSHLGQFQVEKCQMADGTGEGFTW